MAYYNTGTDYDPLMHAPSSQMVHCLPVAGLKSPVDIDVYRHNRVVPLYSSDPCIGPNSTQLLCPPDCGQHKRNDLMEPAGKKTPIEMKFQYYLPRPTHSEPNPACKCPVFANRQPCNMLGPITDMLNCPCINRPNLPQDQHQVVNTGNNMRHQHNGMPQQIFLPPPVGQLSGHQFTQQGLDLRPNYNIPFPPPNTPANINHMQNVMRSGAKAPTPEAMMREGGRKGKNIRVFRNEDLNVDYCCQNPYYSSGYICRPVYDRKYLDDCPEQDGPPADTYTFL